MPPQVIAVRDASKVATALASEKCRRILDHLGKHEDATETQLSKALGIPLSTVHYNMKILLEARLAIGDAYTYSSRGKEVTHYRLNKNPIVIVQEERNLDLLKAIGPAALFAGAIGVAWSLLRGPVAQQAPEAARSMMADAGGEVALKAMAAPTAAPLPAQPDMLPWFLAGVVLTLALSFAALVVLRWWHGRAR